MNVGTCYYYYYYHITRELIGKNARARMSQVVFSMVIYFSCTTIGHPSAE